MSSQTLIGLWAGLSPSFLVSMVASAVEGKTLVTQAGTGGATPMDQPAGGSENHVQAAMKHTQAAAASGQKGDYSTIAESNRGNGEQAHKAAKEAVTHLKAVK